MISFCCRLSACTEAKKVLLDLELWDFHDTGCVICDSFLPVYIVTSIKATKHF
jgi:hypothetical protein